MNTPISLSIVIPCFNEELYVGNLLDDISHQTDYILDIIVADSGSADATLDVVRNHELGKQIQITNDTHKTPGGARNAGARLANGTYILFIDADTRLTAGYIKQLQTQLRQEPKTYITPLFTTDGWHPVDHLLVRFINFLLRSGHDNDTCIPGAGMMMCVERQAHIAIGGFDNNLIKENDNEYLERLRKLPGVTFTYLARPLVMTSSRRYRKQGRLIGILYMTPRNSWLGKQIIYPLLARLGHDKRYGIFTK